jgi:uncharacterized protein with von Willebrand factor type A (vWA) domain
VSTPTELATDRLHGFLRSLADAGVPVSPPKRADFLRALVASPPAGVEELFWRARVTLVTGAEHFEPFETVFDAWFRGGRLLVEESAPAPEEAGESAAPPSAGDGELDDMEWGEGTGSHASPAELTNARTFAATSPAGRERLHELASALADVLPTIGARRLRRARRGRVLDVRQVLRAANRTGGEVAALAWRRRPRRTRRVLVLIDVSGSLRAHSPDLLRFAHVVLRTAERGEAFTFGTRLTRVTRELSRPDVDAALGALSERVLDADGGTRIGVALQEFLADGRYVACARGALIVVLSDGLERGDPAPMADAAERLARLGHRLVWWSPLARDPAYRPATRGMRAVLGHLDELAGAHDLDSLLEEVRRLPETCARPRRTAERAWR